MTPRIPSDTTVAVLMGGWSAEREVSLMSGTACANALRLGGFNVIEMDVRRDIAAKLADLQPDVAFNALHGKFGEDGCMAAILETLEIPYTHSGVLASALAMHKEKSKAVFRAAGVPVAESKLVPIEEAAENHPMTPPYVIKPVDEGSSVGVHIIMSSANGPAKLILEQDKLFGSHVMVERYVPGRELTCAVVGDVALGVIDIVAKSSFFDYQSKYTQGGAQHIYPAEIPHDVYRKVQRFSLMAHQALGCRGVSRADFRWNDQPGFEGDPILLEVNTQPGMTDVSLVPELASHSGQNFVQLVTWMVNDASVNR